MQAPNALEIERTGDNAPVASLGAYVWRMSGAHQAGAALLAIFSAIAGLAPIELQRRVIDDAITAGNVTLLWQLAGILGAALVAHQGLKFALRLYQGWLSESAILYTRRHLLGLYGDDAFGRDGEGRSEGAFVSIVNTEIDKLGGFVGEGPSQVVANVAILIGAVAYMLIVEPAIALAGLALLIPQAILTPLLQPLLNRLIEKRVRYMRRLGERIPDLGDPVSHGAMEVLPRIYRNRMLFFATKFAMKGLLNLLNGLGPLVVLTYGGWLAIQGETTVGVLVAFLAGFERVSSPLRELIGLYRLAAQARVQHKMVAGWIADGLPKQTV